MRLVGMAPIGKLRKLAEMLRTRQLLERRSMLERFIVK
jgi:hypothetical protein